MAFYSCDTDCFMHVEAKLSHFTHLWPNIVPKEAQKFQKEKEKRMKFAKHGMHDPFNRNCFLFLGKH